MTPGFGLLMCCLAWIVALLQYLGLRQVRRERDELRAALCTIVNSAAWACALEHGMALIYTPNHELTCAHARNVIRAEIALGRRQPRKVKP